MKKFTYSSGLFCICLCTVFLSSCNRKEVDELLPVTSAGQIIADHTIVDKYHDIPLEYIDKVKEMWLVYAGESHSAAIRTGLTLLEAADSKFQVSIKESGIPDTYANRFLRASRATWGDISNTSGWVYSYGEEDWFTSPEAISKTKNGLMYCNTNGYKISVFAFGWCWDDTYGSPSANTDPVYGVHWYGSSTGGPEGKRSWGLDAADFSITGNSVCMDIYLEATQGYQDYCAVNGYDTKVIFTTPPVDTYYKDESGYQAWLKQEHIRAYVKANPARILFDYSDILCYDDAGSVTTRTWNGHVYPSITATNLGDGSIGHIGSAGTLRLAKAMWWMLARIAGWDGN
jgi:hypothetical protein